METPTVTEESGATGKVPEMPRNPQQVVDQLYSLAIFAETFRAQRRCSLVHSQVFYRHLKTYMDFYRTVLRIILHREEEELQANQTSVFGYLGYADTYQQEFQTTKDQVNKILEEMEDNPSLRKDWSDMGPRLNNKYADLQFSPCLLVVYGQDYSPNAGRISKPFALLKEKEQKK